MTLPVRGTAGRQAGLVAAAGYLFKCCTGPGHETSGNACLRVATVARARARPRSMPAWAESRHRPCQQRCKFCYTSPPAPPWRAPARAFRVNASALVPTAGAATAVAAALSAATMFAHGTRSSGTLASPPGLGVAVQAVAGPTSQARHFSARPGVLRVS